MVRPRGTAILDAYLLCPGVDGDPSPGHHRMGMRPPGAHPDATRRAAACAPMPSRWCHEAQSGDGTPHCGLPGWAWRQTRLRKDLEARPGA